MKFVQVYRDIKDAFVKSKYFGISLMGKVCFYNILGDIINDTFYLKKFSIIKNYLSDRYNDILSSSNSQENVLKGNRYCIWVFWWQGKYALPPICQACVKSLYRHNKHYEIRFISKDNVLEYVDVPSAILKKVETGIFSVTHLSDIVRLMLLAKFGGLWVDATLFFTQPIPSKWFEYPFFSIKNNPGSNVYVSRNQWSTFIMGGVCNSPFLNKLSELMVTYGSREKCFIEYMTIDIFMSILFDIPEYHRLIKDLPIQNEGLHKLRPLLNKPFESAEYDMLKKSNVCFKLTYKMDFNNNIDSYYHHILNEI